MCGLNFLLILIWIFLASMPNRKSFIVPKSSCSISEILIFGMKSCSVAFFLYAFSKIVIHLSANTISFFLDFEFIENKSVLLVDDDLRALEI